MPCPLNAEHDVLTFDCGKNLLNIWLQRHALQSQAAGQSKSLVICSPGNVVVGYYSFSVISVEHDETTPARIKKGLARFPIPVFLLARLAVDMRFAGRSDAHEAVNEQKRRQQVV